jgi:hypothetical protein
MVSMLTQKVVEVLVTQLSITIQIMLGKHTNPLLPADSAVFIAVKYSEKGELYASLAFGTIKSLYFFAVRRPSKLHLFAIVIFV